MKPRLKIAEPYYNAMGYSGPYHEIALQVRDILQCEYALVATAEQDSIRVRAVAGAESDTSGNLPAELISKLRDWGPVVVDDCRLVAVPVTSSGNAVGFMAGYSSKRGRFTAQDLEKLMVYSPVAAAILESAEANAGGSGKTFFTTEELLHVSRLITIGELSACFAHEVSNPLMLIRGHLRFVEESLPEGHPLRINFDVIDRASRRIEEMAKHMLDFSRKRPAQAEPCTADEIVSEAVRIVQPYLRSHLVDVQIRLDSGLPSIHGDRWKLVQGIVNLLQNAADAMAELDRRVLSITARTDGNHMRIAVADTGTGISSAHLPLIFAPFFTTKGERGTGLGLYITKQVVEQHRGAITVETGVRGTTFVISLPL